MHQVSVMKCPPWKKDHCTEFSKHGFNCFLNVACSKKALNGLIFRCDMSQFKLLSDVKSMKTNQD